MAHGFRVRPSDTPIVPIVRHRLAAQHANMRRRRWNPPTLDPASSKKHELLFRVRNAHQTLASDLHARTTVGRQAQRTIGIRSGWMRMWCGRTGVGARIERRQRSAAQDTTDWYGAGSCDACKALSATVAWFSLSNNAANPIPCGANPTVPTLSCTSAQSQKPMRRGVCCI
jgi:hypothetical protein